MNTKEIIDLATLVANTVGIAIALIYCVLVIIPDEWDRRARKVGGITFIRLPFRYQISICRVRPKRTRERVKPAHQQHDAHVWAWAMHHSYDDGAINWLEDKVL